MFGLLFKFESDFLNFISNVLDGNDNIIGLFYYVRNTFDNLIAVIINEHIWIFINR